MQLINNNKSRYMKLGGHVIAAEGIESLILLSNDKSK